MAQEDPPFTSLAAIYDAVMADVEYEDWADFALAMLDEIDGGRLAARDPADVVVLDLACGTGNSTAPLVARGFRVTGVDASEQMLAVARAKLPSVEWLRGDFLGLDLERSFQLVTCIFDSLNNLTDESDLLAAFERVHAHLAPGGWFMFDANTRAGVADLWEEGTFEGIVAGPAGPVHYRWTHHFDEASGLGFVTAYWSGPDGEHVERHAERGYDAANLRRLLLRSGFSEVHFREYPDGLTPPEDAPRIWGFARH